MSTPCSFASRENLLQTLGLVKPQLLWKNSTNKNIKTQKHGRSIATTTTRQHYQLRTQQSAARLPYLCRPPHLLVCCCILTAMSSIGTFLGTKDMRPNPVRQAVFKDVLERLLSCPFQFKRLGKSRGSQNVRLYRALCFCTAVLSD